MLKLLTRHQVLHRWPRYNGDVEGRYMADTDLVPGIMLDDDVQVVPNMYDLPDHGRSKRLHNWL